MTAKVLLRSAVLLLLLLAAFATSTAIQNADDKLAVDPGFETPLIEGQQKNAVFHRIKRGFFDFWGSDTDESTTTEEPQSSVDDNGHQTDQDGNGNLPNEWYGTGGQQTDYDDDPDYVDPTSSQDPKVLEVGEVPSSTEHPDAVSERTADEIDDNGRSDKIRQNPYFTVNEPAPVPEPKRRYIYVATMTILESYKLNFENHDTEEFRELSDQLNQAIDQLYATVLPEEYTRSKVREFSQSSDPVETWVTLEIESTSPDAELIRSILAGQVEANRLGNINVRSYGFSFGNLEDFYSTTETTNYDNYNSDSSTITSESKAIHCRGDQTTRCKDGSRCFGDIQKCDGVQDCDDNSDEEGCPREECAINEFRCKDGQCIPDDLVCDQTPDCDDQSDEANCLPAAVGQVVISNNGPVLLGEKIIFRADLYLSNGSRPSGRFQYHWQDDGTLNQNEHEVFTPETTSQWTISYPAYDPVPGPHRVVVTVEQSDSNGIFQPFGEAASIYELTAPAETTSTSQPSCAADEFECSDGQCVSRSARCNGVNECRDAGDEVGCPSPSPPIGCARGELQCRNGNCVRENAQCNGYNDCGDNSDEENCVPSCPPGEDCEPLNLKTYPTDQEITEGQELVIRCRDEGIRRAPIRWFREDGAPLPFGSTVNYGRLEMPNVKVSDSGNYVCEALGVPEGTPGRRVYSHATIVEKPKNMTYGQSPVCGFGQATCGNGDCISKSKVCDGRFDCTDGSDESRCVLGDERCEPNQFQCTNKQCVSKIWRCDGDEDCIDGSDEDNCEPSPPGSPCNHNEYQCASGDQCILKSFYCDKQKDCFDGSDEFGCSKVQILTPPIRMVILNVGETFMVTCTALGVPMPEINWRLNWGHIPAKCKTSSVNGTGTLTCPSIDIQDQGAYSCEAMNTLGWEFATPDSILQVISPNVSDVCPPGKFNSLATTADECISCFCFGVATKCHSADLFTYQFPAPFDQHNVVLVTVSPEIKLLGEVSGNLPEIRPLGRNGVQITDRYGYLRDSNNVLYFALPESYHGSQLKSYGGYLKYTVRYRGQMGIPIDGPSVILMGNNYVLVHKSQHVPSDYETERSVRFFAGEWIKKQGWNEVTASREEIMMALADVENILIKVQYDKGQVEATVNNMLLDTAGVRNTNQGAATFVEECRCPDGYSGLSCEHCASGYTRRDSGPWLGQCYREEITCQPGYYKDPSSSTPCKRCPCPYTDPSNQLSGTCHLDTDGQATCDNCPEGYAGRRCEQCAPGYQGNPLSSGGTCVMVDQCDPRGSISPYPDPVTGVCQCKMYVTGRTCNQCKTNAINLATSNKFGCSSCFCMGVTRTCTSSNWYRSEINVAFTSSIGDFSLVESESVDVAPIVDNIRLDKIEREIVYESFPNVGNKEVYYWQLPRIFLGDRLASYGGNLQYTVRYVPSPGSERSRNNAADVEIISSNLASIRHFSGKQLAPNTAETFTVPLLEDYWQRSDGTTIDREQFLMALADVQSIRIKATYTTSTDQAALSTVSLDTAVDSNTGKERAIEVEQCSCPPGYSGLSCEDCDVGYTREFEALYLGKCVKCSCNGHSTQCNEETGVCENCRDHTTGDNCELCEYGYEGDATRGTPQDCMYATEIPSTELPPPRIIVTISENPIQIVEVGSTVMYHCSGRSEDSNTVRIGWRKESGQLPIGRSYDNARGLLVIRDLKVSDSGIYVCQVNDGFNIAYENVNLTVGDTRPTKPIPVIEPSYLTVQEGNPVRFHCEASGNPPPRLSWIRVQGEMNPAAVFENGIWTIPYARKSDEAEYRCIAENSAGTTELRTILYVTASSVPRPQPSSPIIEPANWIGSPSDTISLVCTAPQGARITWTRPENAPFSTSAVQRDGILTIYNPSLSDSGYYICTAISYEGVETTSTAMVTVESLTARPPTVRVEPERQEVSEGSVAEVNCIVIGDTDTVVTWTKRGEPLGDHIQILGNTLRIINPQISDRGIYICRASNRGGNAQSSALIEVNYASATTELPPPRIIVTISENPIQIVEVGSTVSYHCSGRSEDRDMVRIEWLKESGQLPIDRGYDDTQGLLVIRDLKVSDSGVYICEVNDGVSIAYQNVTLTVGDTRPTKPRPVIEPPYLTVQEGNPVRFHCEASGNPPPRLTWIRVQGEMNPAAVFENGIWTIPYARKSDEAEYRCIAENSAGTTELRTILYVTASSVPRPQPSLPIIEPANWVGRSSDTIRLVCTAPQGARLTWTRSGNAPLPASAVQQDGILTIYNPSLSDSGYYICTAISYEGVETTSTASVMIEPLKPRPPTVRVEPERQEVSQGTVAEVKCIVSGDPNAVVTWTKRGEPLGDHIQILGNTLRIINPQISDRGIYVCSVSNSGGSAQSSTLIDVNRRETPLLELYPQKTQTVHIGGSAILQCRVTSGVPTPTVSWTRQDGKPFSSNVQQLPAGVLQFRNVSTDDGGSFVCSASNQLGTNSLIAIVEIITPPVITITPSNSGSLSVRRGEKVRLTCTASGQPQPSVAWGKSGGGFPESAPEPRTLLPVAVYEINSVSYEDEGSYTCYAKNDYGQAEQRVQIRVQDTWETLDETTPSPNANGGGVTIPEEVWRIPDGKKAEMRCEVYGSDQEPIYLNWKRSDGRSLPQRSIVRGGILIIDSVTKDDAGEYICQGLNSNGQVLFSATSNLDIIFPPRIELYPIQQTVMPGDSPSVTCRVTGDQPIQIEWHAIDRPLPYTVTQDRGVLQFHGITSADAGQYACKATNNVGTAEAVAQVFVSAVAVQSTPLNIEIRASQKQINIGDTIQIQCDVAGTEGVRYKWTRPSEPSLPQNAMTRGPVLRLTNVDMSNSGVYRCTADTPQGSVDKDYQVVIEGGYNDAPTVEIKSAAYKSRVVMTCKTDLEPPIKFQWRKLGGSLPFDSQTYDNQLELLSVTAEDAGTYICTANNGRVNIDIPQVLIVTDVVPRFNGAVESYIAFAPVTDASMKFNIDVSFKPESYDGVILYNGQDANGTGDFLSLSLVGGYPEFRFDLGSSPAVIRGQKPINLGQWHKIKLQRNGKEGEMFVDGEGPYRGSAEGRFQTLDLSRPLYVGGVPHHNQIVEQTNVRTGFVGCVGRLVIGHRQLDFNTDSLSRVGVTSCQTCTKNLCGNNGVCQDAPTDNGYMCLCPAGYGGEYCTDISQACYPDTCGKGTCHDTENGFVCSCPIGKAGTNCELDVNVETPAFLDARAYLGYETPKATRKIELAMTFKPSDQGDGILMYCSQSDNGLGDFIALIIKDRHVEFRFGSESGMTVVRSNHTVQPGTWLHLQASKDDGEGKLSINDEPPAIGRSPGPVRSMTLNTLLYIGGINRDIITVNENVGVERNFRGCISELNLAEQSTGILRSIVDSSNIRDCGSKYFYQSKPPAAIKFNPCTPSPCVHGTCQLTQTRDYSCICEYGYAGRNCENVLEQCELLNPCENDGICTNLYGGYKCDCQLGFSGLRCETLVEIASDIAFRGDGWLELERSILTHEEDEEVVGFEISTNKSSGVILWHGQTPAELSPDDYISLAVVHGYLEYQYNLGSGPAVIRLNGKRVDDGERHKIILKRQGSKGSIELDGTYEESGESNGLQQLLNARGSIYLGGVPDYSMTYGNYQEGFSGCIYSLQVQDSGAIFIGEKAIRGRNVYPCTNEIDRPPIRGDGGYIQ